MSTKQLFDKIMAEDSKAQPCPKTSHTGCTGCTNSRPSKSTALAESGVPPENMNYTVKSSFLLSFLESVPAVSAKLKAPVTADRKFEEVVKSAQAAAVLVLVY